MSYSISAKAATVAAALSALAEKFAAEVVASQPIHAKDQEPAMAAVSGMAACLREPSENEEVMLAINGSLSYNGESISHANVNATASITPKE